MCSSCRVEEVQRAPSGRRGGVAREVRLGDKTIRKEEAEKGAMAGKKRKGWSVHAHLLFT